MTLRRAKTTSGRLKAAVKQNNVKNKQKMALRREKTTPGGLNAAHEQCEK
jgi:hypothetical protein